MLTETLRDLERDGLITRHLFPTKPPSVEYCLAPLGQTLLDPLATLIEWVGGQQNEINAARAQAHQRRICAAAQRLCPFRHATVEMRST